jgi:hypothetical protein
MPNNDRETKAFMTAYAGLKAAAEVLERMSHEEEPDLDKMLVEVKRAKQHYDQCNQVIESIKAQVDSIFTGSVVTEPEFGGQIVDTDPDDQKTGTSFAPSRRIARPAPQTDDDMPF